MRVDANKLLLAYIRVCRQLQYVHACGSHWQKGVGISSSSTEVHALYLKSWSRFKKKKMCDESGGGGIVEGGQRNETESKRKEDSETKLNQNGSKRNKPNLGSKQRNQGAEVWNKR